MDLSIDTVCKTKAYRLPVIISEKKLEVLKDTQFDWRNNKIIKYNKINDDIIHSVEVLRSDSSYDYLVRESRFYANLYGQDSIIQASYNCEINTQSWLICWEICDRFFADYFKQKRKQPLLISYHVESSDFIIAVNHYISRYNLAWDWFATQLNETLDMETTDIFKQNRSKLLTGIDNNGDMSNSSNIRSMMHKFENRPVNFYTASNKSSNMKILYGHVFCCLAVLGTGGNAIIQGMFYITPMVGILYLLSLTFEQFYLYVPKCDTNRVFMVCKKYRGITSNNMKKLLDWLDNINDENTILERMCIFKKSDIPEEFVQSVENVIKTIIKKRVQNMKRDVEIYKQYKDRDISEITTDMSNIRNKYAQEWIKKFHLFRLDESKELIKIRLS